MRTCSTCRRGVLDGGITACPACGASLNASTATALRPSLRAADAGAQSERRTRGTRPRIVTRCIALVAVALAGVAFGACALTQKPAPKATLAATVAPTATVPANALLDDPLTDNHNDWATNDIGCSFGADGFHVMAPNEHYQICGAPMGPLTNGVVTVTVQQLTGVLNGPYGIIFRGSTTLGALDDNTFYWFAINGQGAWALFRQNGSTVTQLSAFTINGAIHTGLKQKNTLSVQFRGQTFTCAINGVGVGVVTDPGSKLTDGGVGLAAGGADAVFTDFVATS